MQSRSSKSSESGVEEGMKEDMGKQEEVLKCFVRHIIRGYVCRVWRKVSKAKTEHVWLMDRI
jgi:hypothetical protein